MIDEPESLEQFADWICERRVSLAKPFHQESGLGFYDIDQAAFILREFVRLLNVLASPKLVADLLHEFDPERMQTASELNAMLARAEHLIRDTLPPPPVDPAAPRKRPTYDRDHQWLAWYEDRGSPTYRSPARIRDRWNRENPAEQIAGGKHGIDTVKKSLQKARRERGSKGGSTGEK